MTTPSTFELHIEDDPKGDKSSLLAHNRKYFLFCIPEDWIFLPDDGHEVKVENSNFSTAFLILNTMIGAGIIVQPYVFSRAGIVIAFFEYAVIGIMIYLGVEMLVISGENRQLFDYSQLSENMLGFYGKLIVDLSIVINNAGALLSYILVIGSLFENIVDEFSSCNAWYCNVVFLTLLPIVFFTIPLCLIRQFGHLALISYFSIAVISGIVLLVFIGGPVYGARQQYSSNNIRSGSVMGAILTVGDIVFALGYSTATFHAYNGMKQRNVKNFQKVAGYTTIVGACMCCVTGLVGYLSFRESTDTNILMNFTGGLGATFKLALIVHLILYIPGDFVILRASLWRLFSVDVNSQNNSLFIGTTLGSISVITFVAILLQVYCANSDALSIVVDITGGMGGSIVYFLVPGLMGWKLFYENKNNESQVDSLRVKHPWLWWKSLVLFVFGTFIFILVLISNEI